MSLGRTGWAAMIMRKRWRRKPRPGVGMAVQPRAAYERQQRRRFRRGGTSASMPPTMQTLRRLWSVASAPIEKVVLVLGARWGLRNGEIRDFNINWWNVDEARIEVPGARPCLRCDDLFAMDGVRWSPKSVSGERVLEIRRSPSSIAAITEFLNNRDGVYYSSRGIQRVVERLYARASLARPRAGSREHLGMIVHGLRASAAMRLALELDNPLKLCGALGWSNLVVARHYISVAQAQAIRVGTDLWEEPGGP